MAAAIMPHLREPTVCEVPCKHKDCNYWRNTVGVRCDFCRKPIQSGQSYYQTDTKNDFAHASCLEDHLEGTR